MTKDEIEVDRPASQPKVPLVVDELALARRGRSPLYLLDRLSPVAARRLRVSPLRRILLDVYHRGLEAGDVMLGAYPRSGSTWTKFVLSYLIAGRDVGFAESELIIPAVGRHRTVLPIALPHGRLIKTHERYRRAYRRAIYLVRDVRSVAVSWFEMDRASGAWDEDLDSYLRLFVNGKVGGHGAWHEHVESWLAAASAVDLLVIRYEDLLRNPVDGIQSIADFVGINASSGLIEEALARNRMSDTRRKEREDAAFGRAMGFKPELGERPRGTADGWREILTEGQLRTLSVCNPGLVAAGYEPI